jgi:FtsH-binding integral membrane protein
MTQAKQGLMINLVFLFGFIALSVGLYLHFGLATTLIITGGLFVALSLYAALKPPTIITQGKGT